MVRYHPTQLAALAFQACSFGATVHGTRNAGQTAPTASRWGRVAELNSGRDSRRGRRGRRCVRRVCYRWPSDDPRSRQQDGPRSEGQANYCTTNCTIGSAIGGSLKSLVNSPRWGGREAEGGGLL